MRLGVVWGWEATKVGWFGEGNWVVEVFGHCEVENVPRGEVGARVLIANEAMMRLDGPFYLFIGDLVELSHRNI